MIIADNRVKSVIAVNHTEDDMIKELRNSC